MVTAYLVLKNPSASDIGGVQLKIVFDNPSNILGKSIVSAYPGLDLSPPPDPSSFHVLYAFYDPVPAADSVLLATMTLFVSGPVYLGLRDYDYSLPHVTACYSDGDGTLVNASCPYGTKSNYHAAIANSVYLPNSNARPDFSLGPVTIRSDWSAQYAQPPRILPSTNGQVIVLTSVCGGGYLVEKVYAQCYDVNGCPQWSYPDAVAFDVLLTPMYDAVPDNHGGMYIVWEAYNSLTSEYDIFGQHLDSNGRRLWLGGDTGQALIHTDGKESIFPTACLDVHDDCLGLIYMVEDEGMYYQRFTYDGIAAIEGGPVQIALPSSGDGMQYPEIESCDEYTFIVTWWDAAYTVPSYRAQKVSYYSGAKYWGRFGAVLWDAPAEKKGFTHADLSARDKREWPPWSGVSDVAVNSLGGCTAAILMIAPGETYARTFVASCDGTGNVLWGDSGIQLSDELSAYAAIRVVRDGDRGAFILGSLESRMFANYIKNDGTGYQYNHWYMPEEDVTDNYGIMFEAVPKYNNVWLTYFARKSNGYLHMRTSVVEYDGSIIVYEDGYGVTRYSSYTGTAGPVPSPVGRHIVPGNVMMVGWLQGVDSKLYRWQIGDEYVDAGEPEDSDDVLMIWPNPASKVVYMRLPAKGEGMEIEGIYNIRGERIVDGKSIARHGDGMMSIRGLEGMAAGVYLARGVDRSGRGFCQKFVVVK